MSQFQHPFNDSLKRINNRLDYLVKQQEFNNKLTSEIAIFDNADIMQLFKISAGTASNWRDDGTLPYSKVKNKFYYKLLDIQKIIEDNYSVSKKKQ